MPQFPFMKRERWNQVDRLLDAALELPPEKRAAFLDEACSGDEVLRKELDALLASDDGARSFLEQPALEVAARALVDKKDSLLGQIAGHYKIISRLGAGGMGEVYLAEDTRLGRNVALKRLPDDLLTDEQARRRFAQEAKTLSTLNHSHIVTIYDLASDGQRDFIAMEYVEGDSLRVRLQHDKLSVKQAVESAAQVASGLATAHSAGIIHRDIKPENLMVTRATQIKILDFGLAKLIEKQRGQFAASNVTTAHLAKDYDQTKSGVIVGTVAYMSPEQAEGRPLDHRTDIFSLGVVLYEMLTGHKAFEGKSAIDTLHTIINKEPPAITEINPQVPLELTDILAKALAKDPAERYQHAGDFELDLRRFKRAFETNSLVSARVQPLVQHERARKKPMGLLWPIIGIAIGMSIAVVAWKMGRSTRQAERALNLRNVSLTALTTDPGYEGEPTFSPDGETIAYVADRTGTFQIFLKQISGGPDINISNNSAEDVQPAFSPDGKQIAFVSTRSSSSNLHYPGVDFPLLGGDIWVMPAFGGSARRIAESGNFPSWSPDGSTIIYTSGTSRFQLKMRRVPAQGGQAQDIPITFKTDEPLAAFWLYPSYSSDKHWITFEAGNNIFVVRAEGGEARRLVKGKRPAWSADSRMIIYSNSEPGKNFSLWQVPFSTTEGTAEGTPEPLTVGRGRDIQAAVSRDGKLIAFAAQEISFNAETLPFDSEIGRQTGEPQPATSGDKTIYALSFSPDGHSIVFRDYQGASGHIWRIDHGSSPIQLTSDPQFDDGIPRWSPDGQTIAFVRRSVNESQASSGTVGSVWLMSPDGANPRLLIENAVNPVWRPDGQAIVYSSVVDDRQNQLFIFDLVTKSTRRVTNEPGVVPVATFSPDSRWLIYQSNASSLDLRALPVEGGESRVVVATPHQDYHPFVSPSGKWLYFQPDHKNIYRVPGPAQDWQRGQPEKATNFPESGLFLEDPQLSHDGRQLLYSRGRITGDIWIMKFER